MSKKFLVLYHRENSIMDKKTQSFSQDEEEDMRKFVEAKVLSGLACHVYELRESFVLNKSVETINKGE